MFPDFSPLTNLLSSMFLAKLGLLILLASYIIFAFIIFHQVNVMNALIREVRDSDILKIIIIVFIVFAFSLFLTALVIL